MKKALLKKAAELGAQGFEKGYKAPCQDPAMMKLIEEHSDGLGWALPYLDAYSKARHAAQQAAVAADVCKVLEG